jgi:uncharacterized membrane protein
MNNPHLRYLKEHQENAAHPFGTGGYGRFAERVARSMGTPRFLIGQTTILIIWIALNGFILHGSAAWDVYPFILLNLALSFQAAYAAPLILVASNRQGQRDALRADADAKHREDVANGAHTLLANLVKLLGQNTDITEQVHALTEQMTTLTEDVHAKICSESKPDGHLNGGHAEGIGGQSGGPPRLIVARDGRIDRAYRGSSEDEGLDAA